MHPFQENIQTWLSRKVASYARNPCLEIPFVLASDIGLVRKENQDRTAALYTGKKSTNPLFAIAVADGMGGMRDGGKCSTLALSSFFYSLIQHRNLSIQERALEAITAANSQVFDVYGGAGGSTLTAVLLDSRGTKIIVHIGDTRVYTFSPMEKVERHTTDDSLVEAVGGSGRELLQFVGMGESMLPNISELSKMNGFCAITSDGIHGLEERTLYKLLENSGDIYQASSRLNAASLWCGGKDNLTSAIFNIDQIEESLARYEGNGIRIWDAEGDLTTLWLREEDQAFNVKRERKSKDIDEQANASSKSMPDTKNISKKSKPPAKTSKKKKERIASEKIQLNIEIENSDERGEDGANSK